MPIGRAERETWPGVSSLSFSCGKGGWAESGRGSWARSYGLRAGFTGADANRLRQFQDEDLAVADLAGARDIADGFHHLLGDGVGHRQLDPDLGKEIHPVLR